MTNREWLESLSDEDLAKVINKRSIYNNTCIFCDYNESEICVCNNCVEGRIQWLKAERKESENKYYE